MTPKDVYAMRPCYSRYKYTNFVTNLRNLRKAIAKDLRRAEDDEKYYLHDKDLFSETANGAWHRSKAYDLLKNDIRTGKLDGKKPKEVYNTRVEYQVYPLKNLEIKFTMSIQG